MNWFSEIKAFPWNQNSKKRSRISPQFLCVTLKKREYLWALFRTSKGQMKSENSGQWWRRSSPQLPHWSTHGAAAKNWAWTCTAVQWSGLWAPALVVSGCEIAGWALSSQPGKSGDYTNFTGSSQGSNVEVGLYWHGIVRENWTNLKMPWNFIKIGLSNGAFFPPIFIQILGTLGTIVFSNDNWTIPCVLVLS